MDSPARRYMLDGFVDTDSSETSSTHKNWEGLFAALGISAIGWATIAILIMRFLR